MAQTATRPRPAGSGTGPQSALHALRRHWRWWSGPLALLVGLAIWLVWPSAPAEEPPRARQYLDITACLLTAELGVSDAAAAPVWAAMQEASLATLAKVQYLAITGPQTVENGEPFLNTLGQMGCDLIFAAGPVANATVDQGASNFPDRRFYPVGGGTERANVSPIASTSGAELSNAIKAAVSAAVNGD